MQTQVHTHLHIYDPNVLVLHQILYHKIAKFHCIYIW